MTYEEFKKELYGNVLRQTQTRGKKVRVLEKGNPVLEPELIKSIMLINLGDWEKEDTYVREDILCVLWGNSNKQSMLHWKIRELYGKYKAEGWQSVLPDIAMKLQKAVNISSRIPVQGDSFGQYSDKLILRPLHYTPSADCLNNYVFWKFGDIMLVLYALIYDCEADFMTMKISRDMVEKWNVSPDVVLSNALLNTYSLMPPRLYYMKDILCHHERTEGVFMPEEEGKCIYIHRYSETEARLGYRVTTTRTLNGAIALFYPGVKERLAKLMGGDYYVAFPSIHEAVIHPIRLRILGDMKESIECTNAFFDDGEMLSNKVYRYSAARGELIEM